MPIEPLNRQDKPKHWRDEFDGILRIPRPGRPALLRQFKKSRPTSVLLRENATTTEIVLVLPWSSQQLSEKQRRAYFSSGLSIGRSFDEIVWNPSDELPHESTRRRPRAKRSNSFWAQLARAGYEAYCEAWIHSLRINYLDHFFLSADKLLDPWLRKLKAASLMADSAGRRAEVDAERKSLLRRFDELSRWCQSLHRFVTQCKLTNLSERDTRRQVFNRISGQRNDQPVLSGKAFTLFPSRTIAVLWDAQTWTPRQLATALLALERSREYETMERKIGSLVRRKRSKHTSANNPPIASV
jgi:hypothetical protein